MTLFPWQRIIVLFFGKKIGAHRQGRQDLLCLSSGEESDPVLFFEEKSFDVWAVPQHDKNTENNPEHD